MSDDDGFDIAEVLAGGGADGEGVDIEPYADADALSVDALDADGGGGGRGGGGGGDAHSSATGDRYPRGVYRHRHRGSDATSDRYYHGRGGSDATSDRFGGGRAGIFDLAAGSDRSTSPLSPLPLAPLVSAREAVDGALAVSRARAVGTLSRLLYALQVRVCRGCMCGGVRTAALGSYDVCLDVGSCGPVRGAHCLRWQA